MVADRVQGLDTENTKCLTPGINTCGTPSQHLSNLLPKWNVVFTLKKKKKVYRQTIVADLNSSPTFFFLQKNEQSEPDASAKVIAGISCQ